jgi:hypothetical protein
MAVAGSCWGCRPPAPMLGSTVGWLDRPRGRSTLAGGRVLARDRQGSRPGPKRATTVGCSATASPFGHSTFGPTLTGAYMNFTVYVYRKYPVLDARPLRSRIGDHGIWARRGPFHAGAASRLGAPQRVLGPKHCLPEAEALIGTGQRVCTFRREAWPGATLSECGQQHGETPP